MSDWTKYIDRIEESCQRVTTGDGIYQVTRASTAEGFISRVNGCDGNKSFASDNSFAEMQNEASC